MSKVPFLFFFILFAFGLTGKIANAFRSYGSYPYPQNERCVMIMVNGEGNYFASRCNQGYSGAEGCTMVPGNPNEYYPACCPQSTCSNNNNQGSGYSYGQYPANPANPAPVPSNARPPKRRRHRGHRRHRPHPQSSESSNAPTGPSPNAPSAPVPSAPANSPFIMPAMYATQCVDVTQMGPGDYVATHCPAIDTTKAGCTTIPGPQGVYYPECCPTQKC